MHNWPQSTWREKIKECHLLRNGTLMAYKASKSAKYSYLTKVSFQPILLRNSVLVVNEKTLTPQVYLVSLDTRGFRFLSKAYREATDAGRNANGI